MLVEVRRSDCQPAVVDDSDLRVYVDLVGTSFLIQRAGEQPAGARVCVDEDGELTQRVVLSVVRIGRKQQEHAELIARRPPQLVGQDRN